MERYRPVTAEIVRKLEDIVGAGGIVTDVEKLEVYSHDETSESEYVKMPEIVVKPRDASEVSEILKLANAEMIPVTPRGAGTGLSAGCVPVCGGIVMSMERMSDIIELDPKKPGKGRVIDYVNDIRPFFYEAGSVGFDA